MVPYANFLYFGIAGLYVFLPTLLARLSRAVTPPKIARFCILGGSILMVFVQYSGVFEFAAWGGMAGRAGIVLGYVVAQYFLALALLKIRAQDRWRKAGWPIWTAVLLTVAPLGWSKALLGTHQPLPLIAFAGLSYITFRVIDVLVSIHDGLIKKLPAGQFFAFVLFFPTLSAGPIDRWRRFGTDWTRERPWSECWRDLDNATRHIALGFLYKFILAHVVKEYWLDRIPAAPAFLHTLSYMYAYGVYLFFDFAGYSAFAVGLSHVFGVHPPENFRRPFLSRDIKDFWTRWHISLSFWFRDFVYMRFLLLAIKRKWFKNQYHAAYAGNLVTFGLMGVWHGLAWNYIIYGLYHAALMTGYDLFARWNRPQPKLPARLWGDSLPWQAAGVFVTMHAVFFGFLIFPATAGGKHEEMVRTILPARVDFYFMEVIFRRGVFAFLLLFLATWRVPSAWADDNDTVDPSIAAIDQFVGQEMEQQRIPGLSLAVTMNNELIFTKGYGLANVELRSPALAESVYEVASITKQFTAVAILLLVQDHKLTLDDTLGRVLPGGPETWNKITIRHLLTHTSGIPDFDDGNAFDERRDYSEDDLVRLAAALPLKFATGSRWSYSNTAYVLLGIIVHRVSNKSYGDFLRERVFSRLHMANTRVNSESDIIPFRADGYRLDNGLLKNQEFLSSELRGTGDGGMVSTVVDMAKWDAALQSGALLPPDVWQQVFTPVSLNSGKTFPYGFGWFIREQGGHPYYEHSGNLQGYASHFLRFPRARVSVVVLANLSQADPWKIAHGVAGLIRPDLKPPADRPIEDREPVVTQRFRDVLGALREGKLREEAFTDNGRDAYNADVLQTRKKDLGNLPGFGDFILIGRVEVGDDTEYRYWVQVGPGKWLLEAALDPEGKIERLQFNPL